MKNTYSYEEVYKEYYPKVMGYMHSKISSSYDAEDLASTVFIKIFEKFETFDQSKASISTWIYTVTRNTVIDYFRVRKVHEEIGEEDIVEDDTYQGILDAESLEELADALEKLPERERDIIILHYYSGMQLKEIAPKLNMSYSNCKLVHNKALMRLRQYMTFD